MADEDPTSAASELHIVAGVMSAAHSEFDPPLGPLIEASDVAAIESTLKDGHGVHASDIILARKAKGLQIVLAMREAGASVETIEQAIKGAPSWGS